MTKCSVLGCANDWKKTTGISFHKFPKGKESCRLWMKRLKFPFGFIPTDSSVVCSDHFRQDDLKVVKSRITLAPDALPVLKDDSDEEIMPAKDQKINSSYVLVTVPCGKSVKNESPLKRKLRLEITYNREIVQIKGRIINKLYKQNAKLHDRIARMKALIKEVETRHLTYGGLCYAKFS